MRLCYNQSMRVLCVDYGDKRTGLAISDELGMIASPLPTYKMKSMRLAIDHVASLAAEKGAMEIVVGLPLNMDGSESFRSSKTRAFAAVLERVSGLKVVLVDERLTSAEAEEILKEGGENYLRRAELVDSMAARLILESYLEAKRKQI